jgi:hypothetical protein
MRIRKRSVAFAIVIALLTGRSLGDTCPFVKYVVRGRVTLPAGLDPSGIRAYAFLNDDKETSGYPIPDGEEDGASLETSGSYALTSWFSTDSGSYPFLGIFGNRCRRQVTGITVVFAGRNIRARLLRFPVGSSPNGARATRKGEAIQLDLPEIRLRAVNDRSVHK